MLDPRTKFLATVGLIAATLLTEHFTYLAGIAVLLMVVLLVSKTPLRALIRNVLLLSWLLVFTFLTHFWGTGPLFQPERMIRGFSVGGLTMTHEGFVEGVFAVSQLIIVVGWGTILGYATSPLEMVMGLEQLLRPLRVLGIPVQKFSMMIMLSLRFIPMLFAERQHLVRAYRARGLDLSRGNMFVRLKNYALLCVPLFTSMLRRVEHLTLAMESRAFCPQAERTALHELRMTFTDYLVLGGSLIILWFSQDVIGN